MRKEVTGELENLTKIFQYRENELLSSCKVFLFIMSDSKLVQIAFIDAVSCLPPPFYLLWCHSEGGKKSCCRYICSFPSHFSQIRARGRWDLLAIFCVFMKTLPHFQSRKNVRSFAFRGVRRSAYHISRNENKRHDHFENCHQHIMLCATPADEKRQLQDVRLCQPWPEGFLSFRLFTPVAKYNQHVGLFRLLSEAAWWRSSCLIRCWP